MSAGLKLDLVLTVCAVFLSIKCRKAAISHTCAHLREKSLKVVSKMVPVYERRLLLF